MLLILIKKFVEISQISAAFLSIFFTNMMKQTEYCDGWNYLPDRGSIDELVLSFQNYFANF